MKKVLKVLIILILIVLDWAALHDILKGEPNLYAEYGIVIVSLVVFIGMYIKMEGKKNVQPIDRNISR